MRSVQCILIFIGTLILSPVLASAQQHTPKAVIQALYGLYGIGANSGKDGLDEKAAESFFDARLLKLYKAAVKSGGLDFDFFVQGQDWDFRKPIDITKVTVTGKKARVWGTLTQNDWVKGKPGVRRTKFVFNLVRGDNDWRLNDAFCARSSFKSDLLAAIKLGALQ
jgi:hypothetical protein